MRESGRSCPKQRLIWCATLGLSTSFGPLGARFHDDFSTSPFAHAAPRWCERYHHGHYGGRAVHFSPSAPDAAECEAGRDDRTALSCAEGGCGLCGCCGESPCAKVGDPLRNAVIQTVEDSVGSRRSVTATFRIERQLPTREAHLGLYAALHPHCHTTAQALLVHEGGDRYHLNLAAFNQFIGGDPELYGSCREDPLAEISPPLAGDIRLREGETYAWTVAAELDPQGDISAFSSVRSARGDLLGQGCHIFRGARASGWFGREGRAARYGFGAQFGIAPSPSGDDPSVLLLDFDAVSAPPTSLQKDG